MPQNPFLAAPPVLRVLVESRALTDKRSQSTCSLQTLLQALGLPLRAKRTTVPAPTALILWEPP